MARINGKNILVQDVGSQGIVIMDDSTGAEIVVSLDDLQNFELAVHYFVQNML